MMNNFRPQSAVIRTEDPRFLTGAGEYVDDINDLPPATAPGKGS